MTTLGLMLCCVSCVTSPRPAVSQAGNAILAELPAGTILQFPSTQDTSRMQRLFINETEPMPNGVRLTVPLKICTSSYLAERDAAEMELHRTIQTLRLP